MQSINFLKFEIVLGETKWKINMTMCNCCYSYWVPNSVVIIVDL